VFVHISFTCFQINHQSSILRYGLLYKQTAEKESQATTFNTSTDIVSKSRLVPVKRFFQDESMLIPAPAGITGIIFIPYQVDQYTSPPVNKFSARICQERGPPVAV
jgi:hypothetical protein